MPGDGDNGGAIIINGQKADGSNGNPASTQANATLFGTLWNSIPSTIRSNPVYATVWSNVNDVVAGTA